MAGVQIFIDMLVVIWQDIGRVWAVCVVLMYGEVTSSAHYDISGERSSFLSSRFFILYLQLYSPHILTVTSFVSLYFAVPAAGQCVPPPAQMPRLLPQPGPLLLPRMCGARGLCLLQHHVLWALRGETASPAGLASQRGRDESGHCRPGRVGNKKHTQKNPKKQSKKN